MVSSELNNKQSLVNHTSALCIYSIHTKFKRERVSFVNKGAGLLRGSGMDQASHKHLVVLPSFSLSPSSPSPTSQIIFTTVYLSDHL